MDYAETLMAAAKAISLGLAIASGLDILFRTVNKVTFVVPTGDVFLFGMSCATFITLQWLL